MVPTGEVWPFSESRPTIALARANVLKLARQLGVAAAELLMGSRQLRVAHWKSLAALPTNDAAAVSTLSNMLADNLAGRTAGEAPARRLARGVLRRLLRALTFALFRFAPWALREALANTDTVRPGPDHDTDQTPRPPRFDPGLHPRSGGITRDHGPASDPAPPPSPSRSGGRYGLHKAA